MSADPTEIIAAADRVARELQSLLDRVRLYRVDLETARKEYIELRRTAGSTADRDRLADKISGIDIAIAYYDRTVDGKK